MAFDMTGKTPETGVKPVALETAPNPEAEVNAVQAAENRPVQYVEQGPQKQVELPKVPDATAVMEVRRSKDPLLAEIEETLADKSVLELYNSLSPSRKAVFQATGEKLAKDIFGSIQHRKVNPHVVLKGVRAWLRQVNGVNVWYLEQEAKTKLDSVLELAEQTATNNNVM